jgi:thioesterase domain-containing protein/acyl carrier protein
VGYVVLKEGEEVKGEEIRERLKEHLPAYMLPARIVLLERMPLTANGKLDRKALPSISNADFLDPRNFVAPRNPVERELARIWEELFKTHPIGVQDDFFDLGGNSLLAVRLMAIIEKRMRKEIPLASLFRGRTIAYLAKIFTEQDNSNLWSPTVAIQPDGAKRIFFCVHAIGGNVLSYQKLARHLGPDQPFYGLQAPPLTQVAGHQISIVSMAAQYLEAIKSVQPEGPYLLGGWSFGGIVAFEMACQLQKQGGQAATVFLLDTWSPGMIPEADDAVLMATLLRDFAREQGKEVSVSIERLSALGPEERLDHLLEIIRNQNLVTDEIGPEWLRAYLLGYRARNRAEYDYKPEVYHGPLNLIRSSEIDRESLDLLKQGGVDLDDASLGWGKLTTEAVRIEYVPGSHETMVREPHVAVLAQRLSAQIEETAGGS